MANISSNIDMKKIEFMINDNFNKNKEYLNRKFKMYEKIMSIKNWKYKTRVKRFVPGKI